MQTSSNVIDKNWKALIKPNKLEITSNDDKTVAKVVAECEDVEDDEETEEDETVVCPTNDDLGGSYTYDVTVSSKNISHFKNRSSQVEYWIALEPESTYSV